MLVNFFQGKRIQPSTPMMKRPSTLRQGGINDIFVKTKRVSFAADEVLDRKFAKSCIKQLTGRDSPYNSLPRKLPDVIPAELEQAMIPVINNLKQIGIDKLPSPVDIALLEETSDSFVQVARLKALEAKLLPREQEDKAGEFVDLLEEAFGERFSRGKAESMYKVLNGILLGSKIFKRLLIDPYEFYVISAGVEMKELFSPLKRLKSELPRKVTAKNFPFLKESYRLNWHSEVASYRPLMKARTQEGEEKRDFDKQVKDLMDYALEVTGTRLGRQSLDPLLDIGHFKNTNRTLYSKDQTRLFEVLYTANEVAKMQQVSQAA